MIGPAADDERLLQGDYSYPAHTEIVQPRDARGPAHRIGRRLRARALLPGVGHAARRHPRARAPTSRTRRVRACAASAPTASPTRSRRAAAADVAICFVGGRSGLMPDCTSGEFRDVSDLGLPGVQQQLVEAVVATGTPTVVVVVSGRAHALPVDRRARARGPVRVGARRAGRRRDRRRAVRRRVAVGPAADLAAAQRRSRPGAPRPSRRRRPQPDLRRLRRRARVAALLLRPRPHVHDVRVRRAAREQRSGATDAPFTVEVEVRNTGDRAPAPRSCSSTCATRSRASPGPTVSSPASRACTLEPGEARPCASRSTRARSRTTTRRCAS